MNVLPALSAARLVPVVVLDDAADAARIAYNAAYPAYAAHHATLTVPAGPEREAKWKLYIDWLIEELAEYESKQNVTT